MTLTSSSRSMRHGMLRIISVLKRRAGSLFMASDACLVGAAYWYASSSLPSGRVVVGVAHSVMSSLCTSSSGHIVVVDMSLVMSHPFASHLSDVWWSIASLESKGSPALSPPRESPPFVWATLWRNSCRRPKKLSRRDSRAANGEAPRRERPMSAGTLAARGGLGGASSSLKPGAGWASRNLPRQVRTHGDASAELLAALVMVPVCSLAAVE
mmetsp:Transcript_13595/g.40510  ORF Transcript_13595/g.40510 Transcript_13595/m.40510 type:complete len:212 (+) Transcript_13595:342-977(+)